MKENDNDVVQEYEGTVEEIRGHLAAIVVRYLRNKEKSVNGLNDVFDHLAPQKQLDVVLKVLPFAAPNTSNSKKKDMTTDTVNKIVNHGYEGLFKFKSKEDYEKTTGHKLVPLDEAKPKKKTTKAKKKK